MYESHELFAAVLQDHSGLTDIRRMFWPKSYQFVLPIMGVLLIAVCHASATLEVLWASPACNLPCEKSGDK